MSFIYTNKKALENQEIAGQPRISLAKKIGFGLSALVAGTLITLAVPYAQNAYEMYIEAREQARQFNENHSPLSDDEIRLENAVYRQKNNSQ